jgi:uncharacterized protein (DUF3084 family)
LREDRTIGSKIRASTRKNEVLGIKSGSPSLLRGAKAEELKVLQLKRKEKKLEATDAGLAHEGRVLGHKNTELKSEDRKLEGKKEALGKENRVLAHKDGELKAKGDRLEGHNAALAHEGRILTHQDNALKAEKKELKSTIATEKKSVSPVVAPVVRPKTKLSARDFDDDLFERDFEDVDFDARDFDDELYLD